jgi:hypothetical protein
MRGIGVSAAVWAAPFAVALGAMACTPAPLSPAAAEPPAVEHVMVYYEPGMFGGWPANHGIWIWGDEILVGFTKGYYKDMGERHHIDRERPEYDMLARSLDGGRSWTVTDPQAEGYLRYTESARKVADGGFLKGVPRTDVPFAQLQDPPGGIDFTHPDFALTVRTDSEVGGTSYFSYSYDRGRTWEGPFRLPGFGTPGTAARTDYIVNGPRDCILFITVAKEDGTEGRPICVRTEDGGKTWKLLARIGPEPVKWSIMPASVRISENEILVVVRRSEEGRRGWQAAYLSTDNGETWEHLNDPGLGNAPALIKLRDGRICLIRCYRDEPYSIRAKLSDDNGRTWSDDIILRDDGGDHDIGYPRVVQRPDGKLVVVYYFHDPVTGPERYIAATIWAPGPAGGQRAAGSGP